MPGVAGAEADKPKRLIDAGGRTFNGCPTPAKTDSSGYFGIYRARFVLPSA